MPTRSSEIYVTGHPGAPLAVFFPPSYHSLPSDDVINGFIEGRRTRSMRLARNGGVATPEQVAARVEFYGGLCWICRAAPVEHIDHVKPVAKGGTGWPANLRPACGPCNRQKAAQWPFSRLEAIA